MKGLTGTSDRPRAPAGGGSVCDDYSSFLAPVPNCLTLSQAFHQQIPASVNI